MTRWLIRYALARGILRGLRRREPPTLAHINRVLKETWDSPQLRAQLNAISWIGPLQPGDIITYPPNTPGARHVVPVKRPA